MQEFLILKTEKDIKLGGFFLNVGAFAKLQHDRIIV